VAKSVLRAEVTYEAKTEIVYSVHYTVQNYSTDRSQPLRTEMTRDRSCRIFYFFVRSVEIIYSMKLGMDHGLYNLWDGCGSILRVKFVNVKAVNDAEHSKVFTVQQKL